MYRIRLFKNVVMKTFQLHAKFLSTIIEIAPLQEVMQLVLMRWKHFSLNRLASHLSLSRDHFVLLDDTPFPSLIHSPHSVSFFHPTVVSPARILDNKYFLFLM